MSLALQVGAVIEIDGASKSGSGTIVRTAAALSALTGQPVHVSRARARRPKPGLRPQHLAAVRACAELCGGSLEGAAVGASEFCLRPGGRVRGGAYAWDIGTAGSTTMLALGVLPVACFADAPVTARISGGVFQDFAPSPHHLQEVLLPLLRRAGVRAELELVRAGYVPEGAGLVELRVEPADRPLAPLHLLNPGTFQVVTGIAFSSHLAERRVSERMAAACEQELAASGLSSMIARVEDTRAARPGASLAIWGESTTGCRYGADRVGAPRRRAETIGRTVAQHLLADTASGATVDRHVADQLIPFAVLAEGITRYAAPRISDHVETQLWLAGQFGARARSRDKRIEVEGLGL